MTDDGVPLQRESDLTQRLDERDLLNVAHDPGTYALRVSVPSMPTVAREEWRAVHDADPPEDALDRLANAELVAYVGAASNVYRRLAEHVRGDARETALLEAFDVAGVVDVWPTDEPFEHEYNRASRLARDGWTVWCDGRLL